MLFLFIILFYLISLINTHNISTLKINKAEFPSISTSKFNYTYLPLGYKFYLTAENTMTKVLDPEKSKNGTIDLTATDNSGLTVRSVCNFDNIHYKSLKKEINFTCETTGVGENSKIYSLKQFNKPADFGEFYLKIDNNINYTGMAAAGPCKCIKPNLNYKVYKQVIKDGKIILPFSRDINMEQIYDLTLGEISIFNSCTRKNTEEEQEIECFYSPKSYDYGKVYDANIVNYCKEKIRVLGVIFLGDTYNNYNGEEYDLDDNFDDEYDSYSILFNRKFILILIAILII